MVKSLLILLSFLFMCTLSTNAQDTLNYKGKHYQFIPGATDTAKSSEGTYIIKYIEQPDEATIMRSNGKIYVVVTVLATIFAGIFSYLVYLDRKISKLEKEK